MKTTVSLIIGLLFLLNKSCYFNVEFVFFPAKMTSKKTEVVDVAVNLERNPEAEAPLPENIHCFLCGSTKLAVSEKMGKILIQEKVNWFKLVLTTHVKDLFSSKDKNFIHFQANYGSCSACLENITTVWKILEDGREKLINKCVGNGIGTEVATDNNNTGE